MPGEMTKGAGLTLPEISKRQCLNALIIFTKTGHLFSINEPSKVIQPFTLPFAEERTGGGFFQI